jgi:hypothetical protein
MIAVEHQAQVGGVDGVDDSSRLLGGGQEIPRRIIAIERFNHQQRGVCEVIS